MDEEFHWSNFFKRHSKIVKRIIISLVISVISGASGALILHFATNNFILEVLAILFIVMSVAFLLASVFLFCTIFN